MSLLLLERRICIIIRFLCLWISFSIFIRSRARSLLSLMVRLFICRRLLLSSSSPSKVYYCNIWCSTTKRAPSTYTNIWQFSADSDFSFKCYSCFFSPTFSIDNWSFSHNFHELQSMCVQCFSLLIEVPVQCKNLVTEREKELRKKKFNYNCNTFLQFIFSNLLLLSVSRDVAYLLTE